MSTLTLKDSRLFQYLFLGIFLLVFGLSVTKIPALGGAELHTIMESLSALVAFIVGVLGLIRYYARKESLYLFFGSGFVCTALLDGYHALVTNAFFLGENPSPLPSLMVWSWFASRLFLSTLLFFLWLHWYLGFSSQGEVTKKEYYTFFTMGLYAFLVYLIFTYIEMPRGYYPELFFSRPEDLVPGAFFLLALVGHFQKGRWQKDGFEHWLLVSLILCFVNQFVFISLSSSLFDLSFNLSHILKLASYGAVFVGLSVGIFELFIEVEKSRKELAVSEESLKWEVSLRKEREAQLEDYNSALKTQKEKLDEQIQVVLNLADEANLARKSLEQANKELDRSNRELEQFAYIASHDLKAPLRAIFNYAEWVLEDADKVLPKESKDHLLKLKGKVVKMQKLLEDLLAYAQVGYNQEESKVVATRELVLDIIDLVAPETKFNFEVSKDLPEIKTPKSPLEVVIRNLISNSIKHHNKSDGSLNVSATVNGDWCEFVIADDGPGIDAKYHTHIFEMFKSLNPNEGTGMGLALVKKIVNSIGGHIKVESKEGSGASFSFTWPVEQ